MPKKDIQEELKNLLILLKKEKDADLQQYRQKMAGTSLKERRKKGVCWYPINLEKTKYDAGERLIVKISRPPEHTDAHLFQSGKLISLLPPQKQNILIQKGRFIKEKGESDLQRAIYGHLLVSKMHPQT